MVPASVESTDGSDKISEHSSSHSGHTRNKGGQAFWTLDQHLQRLCGWTSVVVLHYEITSTTGCFSTDGGKLNNSGRKRLVQSLNLTKLSVTTLPV